MKIILGKHHKSTKLFAYEITLDDEIKSGDFAIVEDSCDFTLVKVIMVGEIDPDFQWLITQGKGCIRSRVLFVFSKEAMGNLAMMPRR